MNQDLESLPEPPEDHSSDWLKPVTQRANKGLPRWAQRLVAGFTAIGILSGGIYLLSGDTPDNSSKPSASPAPASVNPGAVAVADRFLDGVAERTSSNLGINVSSEMVLVEWCKLAEISHEDIESGWAADPTFPVNEASPQELHDELDGRC